MFFTYILRCADNSYYTGHTDDLHRRIDQHQSGAVRGYTFERRPIELLWSEAFETRAEAQSAETRIKNWSREKKEALIAEDWQRLSKAAVPPSERKQRASAALGTVPRPSSGNRDETTALPPIIILVRPQLGQNIGKAARAMLNFGLTELRLVAPRDGWPNPDAGPTASGADRVLEQAKVFATVADAVADCTQVFASTVRRRELVLPVIGPAEMATEIHAGQGRSAILFGPERSGLATEDVALAGTIVTVPINPEFGSLNLAQAVILLAYEWSRSQPLAQPTFKDVEPPAPQFEVEGLVGQVDAALEAANYYFPPDRTEVSKLTLRTLLTKPGWSSREVRALRGMLRSIAKGSKR
ncbi:TrmH family RNA methyltransferase [Sphingomonas sp.]|uniref:TrmH family RNA methyltransferase n=1 Tax=Sphingomonas sp. TaxID=28214 RepID=UPI00286A9A7E|nr:TrmH family RNA methyltransferase [Sphingomonas sp.]